MLIERRGKNLKEKWRGLVLIGKRGVRGQQMQQNNEKGNWTGRAQCVGKGGSGRG